MLKDIEELSSEGVSVAAVHELNAEKEMVWNIYLINYKNIAIEGVLVMSKGDEGGEGRKTSTLRHFLDTIEPQSFQKIEPFPEDLAGFRNQYFVTYYAEKTLCEKTFTFEPYTIHSGKAEFIEIMSQNGIELR